MSIGIGFLTFLIFFVLVGVASGRRKKSTTEDYLVAGRDVNPWLTALSAVATNNSGFMFMGMIGFTYAFGLQTIWMALGWVLGDFIAWRWVYERVRTVSGAAGVHSVPELIGSRPDGGTNRPVVVLGGLFTFCFLCLYAAAQLKVGGKALDTLFAWPAWLEGQLPGLETVGAILGAVVVVIYCYSGGLRASIWTDAAQSIVMLGAMLMMLALALFRLGGPGELFAALEAQDPSLLDWYPESMKFGFGFYLLGMVAGGFSAIGQPHLLIRVVAIESPEAISRARLIYFSWYIPFFLLTMVTALCARVLVPGLDAGAAEGAMLLVGSEILPEFLIGVLLAGMFSATISTADSQLLACSAAITQDVAPRLRASYVASKVATLSVAAASLTISLVSSEGVFALVLRAVSFFGASFAPLLILRLARQPVSSAAGVATMIAGALGVIVWEFVLEYADHIYPALPGMAVATATYVLIRNVELGARRR